MTDTKTKTPATASQNETSRSASDGVVTGHLDGVDDEGRILFRPEGGDERIPVSIGLSASDEELVQAAWLGKRALVLRTADAFSRGVLVSLVRERVSADASARAGRGLTVRVDGKAVRIHASTEIELRCGKSRLVMRKDGRIEINGTHITSRSRGSNRMKGATIELN